MQLRSSFLRHPVWALLSVGMVIGAGACGGKTVDDGQRNVGDPPTDGGVDGNLTDHVDTGINTGPEQCVDVEVTPSDIACVSDSDCELIRTGTLCDGQCSCGDTAVNAAGAATASQETSSLTLEGCPCADPGPTRCIANQCTLCGLGSAQPAGCDLDGGVDVPPPDAGSFDGGVFKGDAGEACVEVDVSTYDQSCNTSSDCIAIETGEVCTGDCACGNGAVNIAGQARYDETVNAVALGDCSCIAELPVQCLSNTCVLCTGSASDPVACQGLTP
jgi:hypothetical protein